MPAVTRVQAAGLVVGTLAVMSCDPALLSTTSALTLVAASGARLLPSATGFAAAQVALEVRRGALALPGDPAGRRTPAEEGLMGSLYLAGDTLILSLAIAAGLVIAADMLAFVVRGDRPKELAAVVALFSLLLFRDPATAYSLAAVLWHAARAWTVDLLSALGKVVYHGANATAGFVLVLLGKK